MRILRPCVIALSLAAWAPPATAVPFSGVLGLSLGQIAAQIPGSGEGVSTPDRVSLSTGGFATTRAIPLTAPELFPIVELALGTPAGLTAASFRAGAGPDGGFGGDAGLAGVVKLGLFGPPPFTSLTVPLDVVGVEGAITRVAGPLMIDVTVRGGGWTTGTATVETLFNAFTERGGDFRTTGGAGAIVLVSPNVVRASLTTVDLPLFAKLQIGFPPQDPAPSIPEPAGLLLFGWGALAVALRLRGSS